MTRCVVCGNMTKYCTCEGVERPPPDPEPEVGEEIPMSFEGIINGSLGDDKAVLETRAAWLTARAERIYPTRISLPGLAVFDILEALYEAKRGNPSKMGIVRDFVTDLADDWMEMLQDDPEKFPHIDDIDWDDDEDDGEDFASALI